MATVHRVVLCLLVLQMYVHGAPSDVSKLEDIANVEEADVKSEILTEEDSKGDDASQGVRQKRYYNFYGYGFPPINPLIYPNYDRRLQEIANVVRQPAPPPPPPHIPIFFPVIFIPQAGCQCFPETSTNPPQTPPANTNQTNPNVFNRFSEMDDVRQNWGLVVNQTADDDDYDEGDGSRPISFDPIRVNRTMRKPAPPVEHGTVQSNSQAVTTTTSRSIARPGFSVGSFAPAAPSETPSTCDGAVLSCCHQRAVTYNCFTAQGCPNPTSYGNPCDPDVILKVIDKFQRFYGVRN
ncbi:uncharacterized protein LOC115445999 isoform X2 [Manduca sexta]|uniref:uncharacterized protein LOC115445999 isoform X2 n=1 Tax=Manduca sexta TaxID=7130 RepID=UPI001182A762|nr:uncharacterized protein LOC115445999 isoform X2 [Manduca sexta]